MANDTYGDFADTQTLPYDPDDPVSDFSLNSLGLPQSQSLVRRPIKRFEEVDSSTSPEIGSTVHGGEDESSNDERGSGGEKPATKRRKKNVVAPMDAWGVDYPNFSPYEKDIIERWFSRSSPEIMLFTFPANKSGEHLREQASVADFIQGLRACTRSFQVFDSNDRDEYVLSSDQKKRRVAKQKLNVLVRTGYKKVFDRKGVDDLFDYMRREKFDVYICTVDDDAVPVDVRDHVNVAMQSFVEFHDAAKNDIVWQAYQQPPGEKLFDANQENTIFYVKVSNQEGVMSRDELITNVDKAIKSFIKFHLPHCSGIHSGSCVKKEQEQEEGEIECGEEEVTEEREEGEIECGEEEEEEAGTGKAEEEEDDEGERENVNVKDSVVN